jgi:chromosome segregation ATPase
MNKLFNEHKKRILDSGYKYCCLYRGSERICAWNNAGKIDEKLNEIETRLENNPPGLYVIKARNSTSEKSPDQFVIDTTEKLSENKSNQQIVYKEPASEKLLENQRILDLTVKVKELEMQNDYLHRQIDELEAEIAELELKTTEANILGEQAPAPTLLESAKDFLGSLMEFGAPLLDQHFALKQQQLEIERLKLGARKSAPAQDQKSETIQIRKLGEIVETFQDQPDIYEALHEISAKSKSVSEFMQYLGQYNPDLYEQFSKQI